MSEKKKHGGERLAALLADYDQLGQAMKEVETLRVSLEAEVAGVMSENTALDKVMADSLNTKKTQLELCPRKQEQIQRKMDTLSDQMEQEIPIAIHAIQRLLDAERKDALADFSRRIAPFVKDPEKRLHLALNADIVHWLAGRTHGIGQIAMISGAVVGARRILALFDEFERYGSFAEAWKVKQNNYVPIQALQ